MWVRVMGDKESRDRIPKDHRPQVERLGLLLRAVGSHGRDESRSSSGAMCGMDQKEETRGQGGVEAMVQGEKMGDEQGLGLGQLEREAEYEFTVWRSLGGWHTQDGNDL